MKFDHDWVVRTFHSRFLFPKKKFVPMPEWVNEIRQKAKRSIDPTDDEIERLQEFLKMLR